MNVFERVYQIDPEREVDSQREKHPTIELSDEMYVAKFIYKPPCTLNESHLKSAELLKESFTLNITPEAHKNAQNTSKTVKKRLKKIRAKSN